MKKMTLKKRRELNAFVKKARASIERGVKYLNENKPDWFLDTSLDSLDLSNQHTCMLGQAFEDFWNKVYEEGEWEKDGKISEKKAASLGFFLDGNYPNHGYDILTVLWMGRIVKERAKRKFDLSLCKR